MPEDDTRSTIADGKLSRLMSEEEGVEKARNSGNGQCILPLPPHGEEGDLEKGLKLSGNGELENLSIGQESGEQEVKHKDEDDEGYCRVCHLVFDDAGVGTHETMQLGCHCKEDLAVAHRDCAEAWFKIKGNKTCEICGANAQNVVGIEDTGFMEEQWNDAELSNSVDTFST